MLLEQVSDLIKKYRDISSSSSSSTDDDMNNVFVFNGKKLDFNTTNTTVAIAGLYDKATIDVDVVSNTKSSDN